MRIAEILCFFDKEAPFSSAAEWDNSGLLAGDIGADISRILVCLDVTVEELAYAEAEGCELIVSHHPVIFKAKKNFCAGDISYEATKRGISIISLHTNLDKAVGGVNDTLCETLGLAYEKIPFPECEGFLNIAYLPEKTEVSEFAKVIKEKLGAPVQYVGGKKTVSKIGICSGAGADFIDDAIRYCCDGFLTGEASYHKFLDAKASGISLFTAGHFETEIPVVRVLAEKIRNKFNDIDVLEAPAISVISMEK